MAVIEVSGVAPISKDEKFRQIERLVRSSILHGSEALSKLLRYLAEQEANHAGSPVKEYLIATEVFGRPAAFDPRLDSTVRVQTGRLRAKLAEYYASEGASDSLVVELPKGSYALTYHHRVPLEGKVVAAPHLPAEPLGAAADAMRRSGMWFVFLAVLTGLLTITVAVLGYLVASQESRRKAITEPNLPAPLATFWQPFLAADPPIVVYSNAEFVGRPETGMRYFDALRDTREEIMDSYTGVGEVMAIHELERLFGSGRSGVRVKRGRLLTFDDAKNSDLVFVGSPAENLSLRELPSTQCFEFRRITDPARRGVLTIVNVKPRLGEPERFLASAGIPITEDYGIVALVPGLNPGRRVLILAGITTFATQAAVEFVCRANGVEEILSRLYVPASGDVPFFEAVIRVKVSGGVPVQSHVVALHERH